MPQMVIVQRHVWGHLVCPLAATPRFVATPRIATRCRTSVECHGEMFMEFDKMDVGLIHWPLRLCQLVSKSNQLASFAH